MSAKDQMRAMLDELMGTTRNGETNRAAMPFDDYRVCKAFLLGCCPSEILSQTRADIRSCNKVHDLALKADYEQEVAKGKTYNFEYEALDSLESFINDCERKKEVAKRKLKETQDEITEEIAKKLAKVDELEEKIKKRSLEAEEHGTKGEVDESLKAFEDVEELKKKKAEAETDYRNATSPFAYQQQKLRICDICLASLCVNDNDKRLVDHFGGKLHLGFIEIREKLETLRKDVEAMREKRRKERENERSSNRRRKSSRSRSRSRSNSRTKSSSSRSSANYKKSSRYSPDTNGSSRYGSSKHNKSSRHRSRSRSRSPPSRSGYRRY